MSELRKSASSIYRKTRLESWLIAIFSGTLISILLALNYFIPSIWLLTVPFLVLPVFFSAIVSHLRLRHNEQLTFSNQKSVLF